MEPTLSQNCALYYAQHKTAKRRAAFFQRLRAAAGKQAPDVYLRLPHGEQSGRLTLYSGQRTLIDVKQHVKHEDGVKEIKSESRSSSQNRSASDNFRGKPKYLFRGVVK